VSATASLLDAALKYNIIDKRGAWFSYGEEKVGQGREGAKTYLDEHPDFAHDVEKKVRAIMFPGKEWTPPVIKTDAVPTPEPVPVAAKDEAVPEPAVKSGLAARAAEKAAAAEKIAASEPADIFGDTAEKRGPGRPRKATD
jgi:recombination protein RecA